MNKETTISFDIYGNLYFKNNNKLYQLLINGRDELSLEEGEYKIISDKKPIVQRLNLVSTNHLLQEKIEKENPDLDEIDDFQDQEQDENEQDELYDDEIYDDGQYEKYCPENSLYFNTNKEENEQEFIDEDNLKKYGPDNMPFVFLMQEDNQIEVADREFGDIAALYDTYMYENNRLFFASRSSKLLKNSCYIIRLIINDDIQLFFRPIGYREKEYSIKVINENLTLELVKRVITEHIIVNFDSSQKVIQEQEEKKKEFIEEDSFDNELFVKKLIDENLVD